MKAHRVKWLGHVERLDEGRMTNLLLRIQPIEKKMKKMPRER